MMGEEIIYWWSKKALPGLDLLSGDSWSCFRLLSFFSLYARSRTSDSRR